jgi:hypothetical protein
MNKSDTSWLKITPTPTIQSKKLANLSEDTNYSDDTLTVIASTSKPKASDATNVTTIENGTIIVSKNNGDNPNGIHVHRSLKIDSLKITSWDPKNNDVIKFGFGKRHLRPTENSISKKTASKPEKVKSIGIKRLIERALWTQGLRTSGLT